MIDGFKRKIDYLRLSVTDLCNLRCRYCMPEEGIAKTTHDRIFRVEELVEIAEAAASLGVKKIRLTGGEPLVRRGILDLVWGIRAIEGIETLSLTTNGVLLPEMADDLAAAGLDRINISLDSLEPERYEWITRAPRYENVMAGIHAALRAGLTPLKLNVVLVRDFNDGEIPAFRRLAEDLDIEVRFIELMPVGEASCWSDDRYISNSVIHDTVPGMKLIEKGEHGSPAEIWSLPGGRGRFGLINPISHKFCGDCNRLRISADGRLLPCLHSNSGIDIRQRLEEGASLREILIEGVALKPKEHSLDCAERVVADNNMSQVGG